MIRITMDSEALARVRLTYSPMWEVVCSLRVLVREPTHRLHAGWLSWARPRVEPELFELLGYLVPPSRMMPDFLTPAPGPRPRSFRAELALVGTTDPAVAQREIEMCWGGEPPDAAWAVLGNRGALMPLLTAALDRYWKQAVAPVWDGLRALHVADLAYRADELAARGLNGLLNQLHPSMSFDGHVLLIDKPFEFTRRAGPDGLVLVPCAFAWPKVLVVDDPPYPVTVSYAPRGAGTLWQTRHQTKEHPSASLIGRSRAAILALLDMPLSTTQLAEATEMSLPAVSQHLSVLRGSGLVAARRIGRTVLNTRTQLGRALLDGALDREAADV